MPPIALVLLLVAAVLHAGWNLFVKRADAGLLAVIRRSIGR